MSSPIQFQVDLNEIIKKIIETVKDAHDFERGSFEILTGFRRELAQTDLYDGVLKSRILRGSETILDAVGDVQRAALVDAVQDVYRGWQDLYAFVKQPPQNLASSATWPAAGTATTGSETQSWTGPTRGIYWAVRGKSRAKRIMDQIRLSNKFLGDHINEICRYYDRLDPQSTTRANIAALSDALDHSRVGISTQITRLAIQHGRTPSNMGLLQEAGFVRIQDEATFGAGSSLRRGLIAGSKPVLVECIPSTDFFSDSLDRAVRLAMLLNQPPVDGFAILPCLGLSQNKTERRFEFIFDITDPRTEMSQAGQPTASADAILSGFHSLHSQLSKADRNKDPGILRHYKIHEARTRPLSIGQRLTLAQSLAQTVQHLHQANWVHGNINSCNFYFFHERTPTEAGGLSIVQLRNAYLFGFQFSRLTADYSDRRMWPHLRPQDNLHRHPDRQILQDEEGNTTSPRRPHTPHHDIYSLGVVLLEIGLGKAAEELVKLARRLLPGDLASQITSEQAAVKLAKLVFVALAKDFLPGTMGDAYTDITCLCLEGSVMNLDDGESVDLKVSLSTAFRSRVLDPLGRMLGVVG
ncbi:hypothetical protein B0H63DRAFT_534788 [Podospora didyma]|uniref:Protein kinase domain-containing protein n=1 Tax=Podospora didyma TaxID=330526 RepID=A0AAE0N394_9PEZI|nr:hypothetical protein B0H63DRAFT_534788 [Podospora didyma]